jgi:hypothetical protein
MLVWGLSIAYSVAYFWLTDSETVVVWIYRQTGAPSPRLGVNHLRMRWDSESERHGVEREGGPASRAGVVRGRWSGFTRSSSYRQMLRSSCMETGARRPAAVDCFATPLLTRVETCTSTENTYFTNALRFAILWVYTLLPLMAIIANQTYSWKSNRTVYWVQSDIASLIFFIYSAHRKMFQITIADF